MSTAVAPLPNAPDRSVSRRSVTGTVVGNFMEFIDFGSYGFVAAIIGSQFFPKGDSSVQLLSSLAVFGVSFAFRPIGGVVFGHIADRHGRKIALISSVILMSLATLAIGCLPTYNAVGVAAPVLLVIVRALQGLSVGGEFAGSGAFIVEFSPRNRRGLWSSFVSVSAALGTLFSSTLIFILTKNLAPAAMSDWGWRIPFLLALPVGVVALWMRVRLDETPVFTDFTRKETVARTPFKNFGKREFKAIAVAAVFASAAGLGFYFFSAYLNTYLSSTAGFDRSTAILLSGISLLFYSALCPLAGLLSDIIGRKRLFTAGLIAMAVAAVPIFLLLSSGQAGLALVGLFLYGIIQSIINVLTSVILAEMFAAKTRVSGGAIAHNIGLAVFGGSGPLVAAALVANTGLSIAPGIYLGAVMLIAGVVMAFALRETSNLNVYAEPDETERVTTADAAPAAGTAAAAA